MKIGIVCSAKDPEILHNAFRFANLCLDKMDDVMLFLNCGAVQYHEVDSPKYKLDELLKTFTLSEGVMYSGGSCLRSRGLGAEYGDTATQQNLYELVSTCDKVLCFGAWPCRVCNQGELASLVFSGIACHEKSSHAKTRRRERYNTFHRFRVSRGAGKAASKRSRKKTAPRTFSRLPGAPKGHEKLVNNIG